MNTSIGGFHNHGERLQISGTKKRRRWHSEAICKPEQPLYLGHCRNLAFFFFFFT
ncbi:hypothetical protein I7I53_02578 [Histoplasma capsulatum var. duboisii H88]|uniref:Uncharacterized protein n=1 Tax=Ajellomyces capsulatus (strain H88) TaxID=544711 RepID=A0A8A1LKL3_AJEC8|nr:hypothetical protein I7I53_02578 [Histoplasma capsulatum var. duboisii H88]